jgi:hypothetical protein
MKKTKKIITVFDKSIAGPGGGAFTKALWKSCTTEVKGFNLQIQITPLGTTLIE